VCLGLKQEEVLLSFSTKTKQNKKSTVIRWSWEVEEVFVHMGWGIPFLNPHPKRGQMRCRLGGGELVTFP
jgi:hypothetical protein